MYKIFAIENGIKRELNITPYNDINLCKSDVIELNKHYLTKLLKQSILDCISVVKKVSDDSIKIMVNEPDDHWEQIYSLVKFIMQFKGVNFNLEDFIKVLRIYGIKYIYTYKEI